MSGSDTAQKPAKANIQSVEIHLVKINNNGQKADCSSLGRKQTRGSSTSPTNLKKVCADKQTTINVDHPSDASDADKNMHEHINLEKP